VAAVGIPLPMSASTSPPRPPAPATVPVRVVLRPIGTPLPLGMLGQAVASLSLSAVQLSWIPVTQSHVVAWSVLALTVPLQLLAAGFGFLARDAVAGTGTALLAGAWAATAVTTVVTPPGSTSPGLGVVLLGVSCVLLVPTSAGLHKVAAAAVLLMSSVRFSLTGLHELTAAVGWQRAAGWAGLVLALVSTYSALAFELESTHGRTVLPVGRSQGARAAEDRGLAQQAEGVQHEAGVRKVL